MKNSTQLISLLILSALAIRCVHPEQNTTLPQSECRLTRSQTTTQSSQYTGRDETVYSYDAVGQLSRRASTQTFQYTNGGKNDLSTTETFTYDANGLLVSLLRQELSSSVGFTGGRDYAAQLTSNKTYSYTDGRLTGYVQQDNRTSQIGTVTSSPQTTTLTGRYEYDAVGQLTTERVTTTTGQQTKTYQNGQITAFSEQYGTTLSRPFTYQNGLLVKAFFPGSKGSGAVANLSQVFAYDATRRLTTYQEFVNDTLQSYFTQTWQTGKPASVALPRFKGHPVTVPSAGEPGLLTTKSQYYINQQTRAVQHFSEATYTNDLNGQGYVTKTSGQTRFLHPQTLPQVETTTALHTYTNCN